MELYVGIDVSKAHLDIYINVEKGKSYRLENSQVGIESLVSLLEKFESEGHNIQLIICEATGGYERLLSTMLHAKGLPIHVAHANKVRNFAKATGRFSKTDKIDSKLLSEFAKVFKPKPDVTSLTPDLELLGDLLTRRQQLLDEKIRENNRLDKHLLEPLRQSIEKHIQWLKTELKETEGLIVRHIEIHDEIKKSIELIKSIPGIGTLTAAALLTELPELGHINDKQLSALVGVAPLNQDSGKKAGKRYIQGGKSSIRKSLYMSAIVSIRFNPDLKEFYQRLRAKGKAAKIALIAVVRKLLILLNIVVRRQTPWQNRQGRLQVIV